MPETCKEGRGIWLVGLYIRCVRRAGNDAREKIEVWRRGHRGLEKNYKAYLAASFCSSARLFCSSWARWSSLSRARRASTSAARFASASRLSSKSCYLFLVEIFYHCDLTMSTIKSCMPLCLSLILTFMVHDQHNMWSHASLLPFIVFTPIYKWYDRRACSTCTGAWLLNWKLEFDSLLFFSSLCCLLLLSLPLGLLLLLRFQQACSKSDFC